MKKYLLTVIIIVLLSANYIYSEENDITDDKKNNDDESKSVLMNKISKYQRIKIAGIVFTSLGVCTFVSGLTMSVIYQTVYKDHPYDFPCTVSLFSMSDGYYSYAMYINPLILCCNLFGIAMLAVGIPLLAVGAAREYKYKKLLKGLSFINYTPIIASNFKDNVTLGLSIKI